MKRQAFILIFTLSLIAGKVSAQLCTLTSAPGTDGQTICVNVAITPITYTLTGATGGNVTGLPSGVTFGFAAPILTISGAPSVSGPFSYTVTLSGGGGCSSTGTITVNALPVATATSSSPVCEGSALNLTGGPGSMTTYAWTGPDLFTSSSQSPTINNMTSAKAGTYSLTVTDGNGCISIAATTAVVVNPLPIATATSSSPVCESNALNLTGGPGSMTTYAWTGPDLFTSSLQSPTIASVTLAKAGLYSLTVTDGNGCISVAATTTVVVNPLPAAITGTTSVCIGSTTTLSDATAGGSWSSATPALATVGVATGVVTGVSAGTCVISYTLPVTGCSVTTIVTVNPSSVGGLISGSATVCSGTNSTTLTLSGNVGNVVKWQYSIDNFGTAGVDIINTTSAYTTTNLSATTYYRAVIQSGACSTVNSSVATIIVDDASAGGSIGTSATVCSGTNSTLLTLSSNVGNVVKWQYSTNNWSTSGDISNTASTYTPADLTATTKYRAVVQNGVCPSTNSGDATVTVDPPSVGGTIAGSTDVCSGTNSTLLTLSGNTGSIVKWQYYTDNWYDIVNSASTYTATNLSETTKYRAVIQSGICLSVNSAEAIITYYDASVGGTSASDQTICSGTLPANITLSGNTGNIVKWQKSSVFAFTSPIDIAVTSTPLTGSAIGVLTSDTYFRTVVKSGTCLDAFSSITTKTVRPNPTASISVTNSVVCQNASSPVPVITFTNPNTSDVTITYNINGANQTTINVAASSTATLNAPTATAGTFNYSLVSVVYQTGQTCSNLITGTATVTINPLPVPTITGPATPRITSTGNVYTTESGMGTFGSGYQWVVSAGGEITAGGASTNNTVTVKWNATGSQTVSVNYTNANSCTATGATVYNVTVKPLPVASAVTITGTAEVGRLLAGSYTYTDGAGYDEGSSTYQWYRDVTTSITGANDITYTPVSADDGHTISFEVTPVSSSGSPNTGVAVKSSATATVSSSGVPIASDVCIQGIRATGQILTGKYKYTYAPKAEGASTYRWLRDGVQVGTNITYTLTASDIDDALLITFEVTPKSLPSVKTGLAVESYPLARFTMTEDTYSEAIDTVFLSADPSGGVFSGPGVTNGIFAPNIVGTTNSPYTINYAVSIVNPSNSCSQQASKILTVTEASTSFDLPVNTVICHDDAPFTITVLNIPTGAEPYTYNDGYYEFGFFMNDYYNYYPGSSNIGIVSGSEELSNTPYNPSNTTAWSVTIDPSQLSPGNGNNVLYLYYLYNYYYYLLQLPLNIESVGTVIRINDLNPAYCADDPTQNITVDGLYPPGGSATWTGTILTDKNQLVAIVNPALGTPGQTYPVTYQYASPNGCLSNMLSQDVIINPLPDPSFTLNPTYNIDGGAATLIDPLASGGSFVGSGVSENKFFPDIAGLGDHNIMYKIIDANNCNDDLTKQTTVRKALGTFVDLPSVICYRDTTYNISLTGLPSGITILDLIDSKNSVAVTGSSSAAYHIPDAGAGYDTLKFSYIWDGVNYSISKTVFIDSIGKIVITGLKDNYCDYEGTATLRVLVENSTGSGNFGFSGPDTSFTNYGNLADFYPSKTPTSVNPYSVSYTHVSTVNNSGCRKTVESPVTINNSPSVSILNTRTTVNIKEEPLTLSGLPADGIFSGKGVYIAGTEYVFDPAVAGLGNIEMTLSFRDTKGCLSTKKDTLIVSEASGSIGGINSNNQYCYDGIEDTLTYIPVKPWMSGSFSGSGITNTSQAKAVFNPATAGKGDHEIMFTYSDPEGTVFSISSVVNVDSLGQVVIQNLSPADLYCTNTVPFELFTLPKGGFFEGPVVSGFLDPSKGLGDTSVTYTYTNQRTGCFITRNVPITIFPAAKVSFALVDVCIENSSDSIRFINSTISSDPIKNWLWEFSDIGGTGLSEIKEPGYLFKTGGQHLVALTATTTNDCSTRKDVTIDIGIKPVADFYWKNDCYHPNDSIMLFDTTFSSSLIVSRSWNFFDGGALHSGLETKYPKTKSEYLPVQYIVKTNYANCSDTIFKNIFIRPTISLTTDNYFENFEAGDGGWIKDEETINSWIFGKPDRNIINSAASGDKAWFTGYDITQQKVESSSIVSPCFDFTTSVRPMIRLNLWRRFELNRDGAALQYKVKDEKDWHYVGTVNDGITWFNSAVIKGKPGGEQLGWTTIGTPDTKWIEARHNLDDLKGKKDVKFRIAYGSDGTSTNNEGIAFDDILIGERTRNVLLEHFANTSSLASSEATAMINNIALANTTDVINIQYHTNFPGIDSFYINNPGDASARILFYGLTKVPYSFVDGGTRKDYANIFDYSSRELDGSLVKINSIDVTRRSLVNPGFTINLNSPVISGGILSIGGQLTALEDINSDNLTLYFAVTEIENNDYVGANGETTFYNVFRKFIPDAGGINLKKTWTKGDVVLIPDETWLVEKTLNSSDIEVIAFIQNSVTKELYQAVSVIKPDITVGIENSGKSNGKGFALYPNPAESRLSIRFGEMLDSETDINIYNFRGTVVRSYKVGSGETEFVIDNLGLFDGIYLVRVSSGGLDFGFKKLIISNN